MTHHRRKSRKSYKAASLYSHRNGIIDEKFQGYFPNAKLNEEHWMMLDEFLEKFEYLAQIINALDQIALAKYQLA